MVFTIFVSLNYGIHHLIILPGFKTLEVSEATKDMERCVRAIREEVLHVDILCHDWAAWDDLYDFAVSPSSDFAERNLNPDTMLNNRLSLACVIDISGTPLFCEAWDVTQKEKTVLAAFPAPLLPRASSLVLSSLNETDLTKVKILGIYNSDQGPMLISIRPITTTRNLGPVRGAIVLGRLLDAAFIERLAKQVEVDFSILAIKGDGVTREEDEISRTLDPEEFRIQEKGEDDLLRIYSWLPDISGGQDFLIRAEIPRQILAQGRSTFTYSLILISVLALFIAFLVLLLLRKVVLSPLAALTDHVLGVAKTGDLSTRITLSQNDEIGTLGREVDRLLQQMESQTAELAGVNAMLKIDIEKRKRVEQELRDSEERFRLLHEASFGGIAIHDRGIVVDANKVLTEMAGVEVEKLIGRSGLDFIAPAFRETVRANIASDYEAPYDAEGIRSDGSYFPIEIQGRSIPYEGRILRMTEFRDITFRKEMERKLETALEELEAIIKNSAVGIMFLKGGRILYRGNQRLADILGFDTPEEMVGLSMTALHLSEERFFEFGENFFDRLVHGEQIQVEYQLRKKGGFPVWCTLSGKAIDPAAPPDLSKGVVWMVDDITEKRAYQEKLKDMATTDYLTELCNRRHFMELGKIELERQKRYAHRGLSLIMLDLDHFKTINDTHGHEIGDLVLKTFAYMGRKALRDVDVFARVGGEEFVILLPETDLMGAFAIAERFRQACERSSVTLDKGEISFTVSLGVATWNSSIEKIENLMKHADEALYRAKKKGRNLVECYKKSR
ncbi:MAG: diguanylate cyclase [Desulfobacteraceae bacterium]|nr:diguanylate cyclase [Desulfobacteraceae bacterium]